MKRAELLTVIMHDIGLPVIEGVIQVALNEPEEKVIEDVTRLLRQTIDNADDIRGLLDLIEEEEKDVSVRLNLATLSCHIIAAHYKRSGSLPTQAELKRTVGSVDKLLTFSENYIPMERLEGVFPENIRGLSPLSRTVANLVYLKYYVPLVDAVADFSYGQDEARMIQDVSEKLRTKASEITHALMGTELSVAEQKSSELLILSSLIPLYCSCHIREKNRIMALDEDVRAEEDNKTQIENIWLLFEKRLSMLTVLGKHIMPNHFTDEDIAKIENLFTDGSGLVDVASAPDKPLAEAATEENATVPDIQKEAEEEKPQQTSTKSSPMGFFSGNEEEKEDKEPSGEEAAMLSATRPTSSAPVDKEPSGGEDAMLSATRPASSAPVDEEPQQGQSAPPADEKDEEDGEDEKEKSSGNAGSPMSFFSSD
ncbi:MAG: hypothetical protein KAJ29_00115 [Alphaproteobacteria bacterium]|nr:hypothetical protein [Alphaproteobacteria bacterium]